VPRLPNLAHVEAFVRVAGTLHVGIASEELGVGRQTTTARVSAYEGHAGMTLIDRSHRRRIALTAEGQAMLSTAQGLLRAARDHDDAAASVRSARVGVVRVALLGSVSPAVRRLLDVLVAVSAGWDVDARPLRPYDARCAIGYGAIDCTIGTVLCPHPHGYDPEPRYGLEAIERRRVPTIEGEVCVASRSAWTTPHRSALWSAVWEAERAFFMNRAVRHRRALLVAS
jgi:DNA-binding transcriptional LysR family regulator